MNVLMLLAQGAMNMADSLATANPVLTPVSAPEMPEYNVGWYRGFAPISIWK